MVREAFVEEQQKSSQRIAFIREEGQEGHFPARGGLFAKRQQFHMACGEWWGAGKGR